MQLRQPLQACPRFAAGLFLVGLLWCGAAPRAVGALPLETVALTGRLAPGMDGAVFSLLDWPALSNSGSVTFYGQVDGGVRRSVWAGPPDILQVVAETGGVAAGTGGARYEDFSFPILSPSGGILAFTGKLQTSPTGPTALDDRGIWSGPPEALELVVREGTIVPQIGFEFGTFDSLRWRINDAGLIAFLASDGSTLPGRRGLWLGGPGRLELLALEGALAPGTNNHYGFLGISSLNAAGEVAFGGTLRDAVSSENNGSWLGPPGDVQLLVRSGQPIPGGGGKFLNPNAPDVNTSGVVVFRAGIDEGIPLQDSSSIWTGTVDGLFLAARKGLEAPGTGGAAFDEFIGFPSFEHNPIINRSNSVAFVGTLAVEPGGATPDNDVGLWAGPPAALDLVARKGDVAPGARGGRFLSFGAFALNGRDDITYAATLAPGGSVTEANDNGLWAGIDGRNVLVAREGELVDVDPTEAVDLREIAEIHFTGDSGGEDGRRMALNDRRTILFQLDFADGSSGIFTAQVPEPGSILLAVTVGVCLVVARTRLSSPRQSRVDVPS